MPTNLIGAADESFSSVCLTTDGRRVIAAGVNGRFHVWLAI